MATEAPIKHGTVLLEIPKHTYDTTRLTLFVGTVFHADSTGEILGHCPQFLDEKPVLPYQAGMRPMIKMLESEKHGRACFYNTCTFYPDYDGIARQQREYFAAMHCVVVESSNPLPKDLQPTYTVRTGPKAFEHGYVLKEPITDIRAAEMLVQLICLTGKMDNSSPIRIARLPDGLSGAHLRREFIITLETMNGPYWTPEAVIDRLGEIKGLTSRLWKEWLTGPLTPLEELFNSHYLSKKPVAQQPNGSIDPILEWYYEHGFVISDDGGEIVHIECPQSATHPEEAYGEYKPIGRGPRPRLRTFKCQGKFCESVDIRDLAVYVMANSEMLAIPENDPSLPIFKHYAFDGPSNTIWRHSESSVQSYVVEGFRTQFNEKTTVHCKEGKAIRVTNAASLWLDSPYRMTVYGPMRNPGAGPFIKDREGRTWINTFRGAPWGDGDYDMEYVTPFLKYIDYLIPDENERTYFLDWITNKVQDPKFRGTGIVMVAEAFGTGRGTLGNMLTLLVGQHNTAQIPFDKLINPGEFNHWEDKQLVLISEAKDHQVNGKTKDATVAYECLKQRVDTTAAEVTLNIKHQAHRQVIVTTSYLIMTNHVYTISIPQDDRRLTVITNPKKPAPISYFAKLYNDYLAPLSPDGAPRWVTHVYRYLRQREIVNPERLLLPIRTIGKERMVRVGTPRVVSTVRAMAMVMEELDYMFITTRAGVTILRKAMHIMGDEAAYTYPEKIISTELDSIYGMMRWLKLRVPNQRYPLTVRAFRKAVYEKGVSRINYEDLARMENHRIPKWIKVAAQEQTHYIHTDDEMDRLADLTATRALGLNLQEGPV